MEQIGIDPVDMEALVNKVIGANRALYDAMTKEQQEQVRKGIVFQIEGIYGIAEEERRKTLDQVLQIMDVVEKVERIPHMLRQAIIKFRDKV